MTNEHGSEHSAEVAAERGAPPVGASSASLGGAERGTVVVTGAAGFIGSHLVDGLLARGRPVVGLDRFDGWYDPAIKWSNLGGALADPRFRLQRADLTTMDPADLVEVMRGAGVVYHLAGRPGVQDSWGEGFEASCRANILGTQRVLEASAEAGVGRVVLASSSSVYGNAGASPRRAPAPISPYGAAKLAAEQLGAVYGALGLPVVTLRYFTVFGPRQRPDMAFHRLLAACLGSPPFPRRGQGQQRREFTYVGDVVEATMAAGAAPVEVVGGHHIDVGGGSAASLNEVIDVFTEITGRRPPLTTEPGAPGDPTSTEADLGLAATVLGWRPTTTLRDGLAHQWAWQRHRYRSARLGSPDGDSMSGLVGGAAG